MVTDIGTGNPVICLQTGLQNIYGASWTKNETVTTIITPMPATLIPHDTRAVTSVQSVVPSICETIQHAAATQYADVYNIALPGQQRKPYSIVVTKQFGYVDAVDWSTYTFKTDKLHIVQEIIARHGDGLDETQMAGLSELNM